MSRLAAVRARLAAHYRATLAREANALDAALATLDGPARRDIRERAHRLKGSGASFGYPDVTALAARVETAADDALPDAVRALVATLRRHATAG